VRKLLLATNNPGKVREFRRLLGDVPMKIVTPADLDIELDPDETGSSYAENALIKSLAFAKAGQCLALADDSGIEVDALDGAPGALSARFGDASLDDEGRAWLLLEKLNGVPDERRSARYRAVVTVCASDGTHESFEGVMEGTIGHEFRGNGGFGYDPVFVIADGRTSAELTDAEKDAVSHRGIAVRAAAKYLRGLA
jgi:XTP/dITP diphosphohydrolase